jgi:hypothetical protein
MNYPISTGQAAQLLQITEPQLAELVRRGRIDPPPAVFAGRRLWFAQHLLQAARHLDVLTHELAARLEGDGTVAP